MKIEVKEAEREGAEENGRMFTLPTCWKQAWTRFSGNRFLIRSRKASRLLTSWFLGAEAVVLCPLSLGFPGWIPNTRMTPRMAAMTVVDM